MGETNRFLKWGVFVPALLCTMLWGSAIPAVKTGYTLFAIGADDVFAKLFFAGCRFTLAGFAVLLVSLARGGSFLPARSQWRGILALSGAQTVLQYIFFYLGLGNTSGVRGSVLSATSTFFAVILAHFAFADDRLTLRKGLGCLVGFGGVVAILAGGGLTAGGIHLTGEGFMLFSALGQGMGALISRKITPGRDPMQITGWQLMLGGGVLLALGLLGGGAGRVTVSAAGLALLGYLAALSAVAFTVWTMLLKYYAVGRVTIYMFLIPVFGSLLSGLVLGESVLTMRNLLALVLVSGGITLVNSAPSPRK